MSLEDYGIPKHPEADKFDSGTWDTLGHCICGSDLPPQNQWRDAGRDWASITCGTCGRCYVDEGDYVLIYDDGCEDDSL